MHMKQQNEDKVAISCLKKKQQQMGIGVKF